MENYKIAIASNIRKYRKAAGMSQIELAKRIGVRSSSISNWENGANSIDIDTLFRVCDVLGVSVDRMRDSDASDLSLSPLERQVVLSFRACSPERQDIILELLSIKKSPEEGSSSSSKKEA